jgi:hypothetical protein
MKANAISAYQGIRMSNNLSNRLIQDFSIAG